MNQNYYQPHGGKYYVKQYAEGWAVNGEYPSPVAYRFSDKDKAIQAAKYLARKNHAEVVIENKDGSLEKKLSFH